jgi:hypothetical protein
VITHPGAPSRRGEVEVISCSLSLSHLSPVHAFASSSCFLVIPPQAVEKALREICKSVRRMRDEAPSAFCDGGDVMFTGLVFFLSCLCHEL